MNKQLKQPPKETRKVNYSLVPIGISVGIGIGLIIGRFMSRKGLEIPKKIAAPGSRSLLDRFHETTLAIDNELKTVEDVEYRKVLIDAAYRLADLGLRSRLRSADKEATPKTASPST